MLKSFFFDINKIIKSEFFKNSARMGLGVVISQMLNLLYIPLFSRIFAQDAYAIQGNFLSYLNVFFVFCSLGLTSTLAIAKSEEERKNILNTILVFSLIFSSFVWLLLLTSSSVLSINLGFLIFKTNSKFFLGILPLGLFARSVIFVYETELALLGKFRLLSLAKIGLALVYGAVTYISFLLTQDNLNSLVIGNLASYICVGAFMFKRRPINFFVVKKSWVRKILARYRGFIIYSLPNMLMNAVSFSLPSILLLNLYGEEIAGDYAMGLKVVSIPVAFIVASLKSVYLKKISEVFKHNKLKLYGLVKQILLYSHLGSFVLFSFIFVIAPYITEYGLGEDWKETYIFIQLLCIWQFLLIGNSPLSVVFQIIEKQKIDFLREVLLLIFRVIAIVGCYFFGGSGLNAVTIFVIVGFIFNVILSYMILTHTKKISYENCVHG